MVMSLSAIAVTETLSLSLIEIPQMLVPSRAGA
jgi:hypothetical protein